MKLEKHPNIYVRFFRKDRIVKERSVLWTYKRMIEKTKEIFKSNSDNKINKNIK